MTTIDLNCDVGEGVGLEPELLPLVTSANVACGAPAGDDATMKRTLELAAQHRVVAGAHPGFADPDYFGRRELHLAPAELRGSILAQLERLRSHGEYHYVKPHGALYNLAACDRDVAEVVVLALIEFNRDLGLLALAGSHLFSVGQEHGLRVRAEAFADRAYDDGGQLVSRDLPGALLPSAEAAAEQVIGMVTEGRVRSLSGRLINLRPDSICLHGDNPEAVQFAAALRQKLSEAGVTLQSCWEVA